MILVKLYPVDYFFFYSTQEELTEDQKRHAIKEFGLLEMLSFCFTYTGGLTGPQMSFTRFRAFCEGTMEFETDKNGKPNR